MISHHYGISSGLLSYVNWVIRIVVAFDSSKWLTCYHDHDEYDYHIGHDHYNDHDYHYADDNGVIRIVVAFKCRKQGHVVGREFWS